MKSWRPFFSFSSFPNSRFPFSSRPFRPLAPNPLKLANPPLHRTNEFFGSSKLKANHKSDFRHSWPFFRSGFRAAPSPICYRCHSRGHIARSCRWPLRCFSCSAIGHKRSRCPNFPKMPQESNQDPTKSFEDPLLSLPPNQDPLYDIREDILLLDPDVQDCFSLDKSFSGAPNIVRSIFSQAPLEKIPTLREEPTLQTCSTVADPLISMSQGQTCLDFNPVPREAFKDFIIIDEFEDFYSEDEDLNLCTSSDSIVEGPNDIVEESMKDGTAVFRPMDIQKFILYCSIQAVDGFNRLIRARARVPLGSGGSVILSPFRFSKEIKKSCYVECLRDSSIPPRADASVSFFKPAPVTKKKSAAVKPFRGLVLPSNVRRSPRLNKGLT